MSRAVRKELRADATDTCAASARAEFGRGRTVAEAQGRQVAELGLAVAGRLGRAPSARAHVRRSRQTG